MAIKSFKGPTAPAPSRALGAALSIWSSQL